MTENCCVYNKMVDCHEGYRLCYKCGWNPEIRNKRIENRLAVQKPKLTGIKL